MDPKDSPTTYLSEYIELHLSIFRWRAVLIDTACSKNGQVATPPPPPPTRKRLTNSMFPRFYVQKSFPVRDQFFGVRLFQCHALRFSSPAPSRLKKTTQVDNYTQVNTQSLFILFDFPIHTFCAPRVGNGKFVKQISAGQSFLNLSLKPRSQVSNPAQ